LGSAFLAERVFPGAAGSPCPLFKVLADRDGKQVVPAKNQKIHLKSALLKNLPGILSATKML
jgi:hypothetical protein